ncbi:MAG: hypothetical protein ABI605_03325 [Rhizobacter sp.]
MYRDELLPATLVPVPRALEMDAQAQALSSKASAFGALGKPSGLDGPSIRASPVIEHSLPFRVRVVCDDAQLLRVQALRQTAYGRHLPAQAASFGSADPLDRLRDTTIFFAEDKATGAVVGSARVQSNRSAPLQIERSIELPEQRRGQLLAEITRLCVLPGYEPPVRLALVKASHLYCIATQIGGVLAGSRRSLLRIYENLGFTDLFGDERMCALEHAGGLPHRVLFRDTVTSEAMARARNHTDYDFVFRDYHPDIGIFEALAKAVAGGLRPTAEMAWPRAACSIMQ